MNIPTKRQRITTKIDAFLVSVRLPPTPKLGEVARVVELVHKHLDPLCRALGNPGLTKATNASMAREGEPLWLGTAPPRGAKAQWPAQLDEGLREAMRLPRGAKGQLGSGTAKLEAERRAQAAARVTRASARAKRAGRPKRGKQR